MTQEQYNNAMIGIEFANTAVAAADSKAARKHATKEAEKARDWQEQMYDRQLDDNIAWRTHQELYNSPEAQMQRYRDAGINPMYAVTGSSGNALITPNTTSVPMTQKADTPSPRNLRFDPAVIAQARMTQAQVKAEEAKANMYNAQANEANARATGLGHDNVAKEIEAAINGALKNWFFDNGSSSMSSYVEVQAEMRAAALDFARSIQGLEFKDAKNKLLHSQSMRDFELKLSEHRKKLFHYELSHAKSAAEVYRVTAKWAEANQWIHAGTAAVGAASGLVGSFKGTSLSPYTSFSRSFSESYGDITHRSLNY